MTLRTTKSFSLPNTLLEELKAKAKASNRSLNNYVESLLVSILHPSVTMDKMVLLNEVFSCQRHKTIIP